MIGAVCLYDISVLWSKEWKRDAASSSVSLCFVAVVMLDKGVWVVFVDGRNKDKEKEIPAGSCSSPPSGDISGDLD